MRRLPRSMGWEYDEVIMFYFTIALSENTINFVIIIILAQIIIIINIQCLKYSHSDISIHLLPVHSDTCSQKKMNFSNFQL